MTCITLRRIAQTASAALLSVAALTGSASAQEAYMGQVQLFGMNWCPRNYLPANGQLLPIAQYTALFSLLGTTYGGDGRTTFALPDLRGRYPLSYGGAPGLSNYAIGQKGGVETVTLNTTQIPSHNHSLIGTNNVADQKKPAGDTLAFPDVAITNTPLKIYSNAAPDAPMNPGSIGNTGGNQSHENRPPYLAMTWCVVTQGIYPSRP